MLIGVVLAALGYALFQIPFDAAAGGASGVAHQALGYGFSPLKD